MVTAVRQHRFGRIYINSDAAHRLVHRRHAIVRERVRRGSVGALDIAINDTEFGHRMFLTGRDDVLAPDVVDWSVLIVVMMIGVISVAAMIASMIGHGISDCRTANPTHNRTNRTANNSPGNSSADPSSDRAAFVGKGNLR
jgi:hypothetical protein